MFRKLTFILVVAAVLFAAAWYVVVYDNVKSIVNNNITRPLTKPISKIISTPTPTLPPIPASHIIPLRLHVFQSFNNCGPAALSMALSYYGINKTQTELGESLRPYQVVGGDNDDKSVTLEEVAQKAKEYGLTPYLRPNGNIELLKKFIALDLPVITRTWLKADEDIGHYRVVRGYTESELVQDDSLQNKDLRYKYEEFNEIWKKFNYEYLVLVPKDKIKRAEQILGENLDAEQAWAKAAEISKSEIEKNPEDIYSIFNLSVAYFKLGNYEASVAEFEKVEGRLPFRTLWYQTEPIQAYYELGDYDRTLSIIDRVLNYHNRAFSELYLIRGNIYLKQGDRDAAKREFEQAVFYNVNSKEALSALESI